MKKLIGSTTSPYVRRIRLMLSEEEHEFEAVNIFTQEGQALVAQYTTTQRIPLLVDGQTVIWDSFLIANYLAKESLSLEEQKDLILVNELTDSGVQLFQLRKFEVDVNDDNIFSKNHLKRIAQTLDYFEAKDMPSWSIVDQWLFCTLDWYDFREVYPWRDNHPKLVQFHASHLQRPEVQQTDPR